MRALGLLLVIGCHSGKSVPAYVRYIDTADRPATVRATIAERAQTAGLTQLSELDSDVYTIGTGRRERTLTAAAAPQGPGSLLEVTGPSLALIDKLAVGGRTYHAPEEGNIGRDPLHTAIVVDVGFARAPHTDAWWRIDPTAQIGWRVWARGGDGPTLEPRHRISIVAGLGAAIDDRIAFRPELGVMFDRQDAISRLDGRVVPHGVRKSMSLAFSTPIGEDYFAYELGATVHLPPFGGVFARVGYEAGDRGNGVTYMAGLRIDNRLTTGIFNSVATAVAGIAVLAGSIYLLSKLDTGCNKNDPCQ